MAVLPAHGLRILHEPDKPPDLTPARDYLLRAGPWLRPILIRVGDRGMPAPRGSAWAPGRGCPVSEGARRHFPPRGWDIGPSGGAWTRPGVRAAPGVRGHERCSEDSCPIPGSSPYDSATKTGLVPGNPGIPGLMRNAEFSSPVRAVLEQLGMTVDYWRVTAFLRQVYLHATFAGH
jgi:hypothetical protein